jgi:MYXO-CTERM domain-containing protein
LTVRSTDKAGNVDANPPTFTWLVQSGGLDGGVDAEPPAVDLGVDSGGGEAAPVLLDAEGADAFAKEDLLTVLDVAADRAVPVGDDTAPVVRLDAAEDVEKVDLLPRLDAGNVADTKAPTEVASADTLADTQPSGAEPNPDTAPRPEPNADTAGPVANDDVAPPPANDDAATVTADLKIMGSGFCAIASPHSTSPWPFMVMALAALALVRRRRKS